MSRYSNLEDALLTALAPLDSKNGGPFKQLDTFTKPDFDAALQQLVRSAGPICLLVPLGMTSGPLRANTAHDEEYQFTLLIAARNLRGQKATRRGTSAAPGIYELLDQTRIQLMGYQVPALDTNLLSPGMERLFTVRGETVVWRQDWKLTLYL